MNLLKSSIEPNVLASEDDLSVNHVWELGPGRALEARYVRRTDSYFIIYLSSQTGCELACRFCHLTATRQVSFDQASLSDFGVQAHAVFDHYDRRVAEGLEAPAERVNFNWMARGEPLLNPALVTSPDRVLEQLRSMARSRGLKCQFNISSIFPQASELASLERLAAAPDVNLYYSLYSLDPAFRRRWLPKARDPHQVLEWLASMQARHKTSVALHWAVIDGQNDSAEAAHSIAQAVQASGLQAKFNLVRYNPYSAAQGQEASQEARDGVFDIMKTVAQAAGSRVVPRVGFDVKASCGMFVDTRRTEVV